MRQFNSVAESTFVRRRRSVQTKVGRGGGGGWGACWGGGMVRGGRERLWCEFWMCVLGGVLEAFFLGRCTQFVHGRSRMTTDPRIPTKPGRSTSGFHQPGKLCLHQGRSAVRCSASRMKGEHILPRTGRKTDFGVLCLLGYG